MVDPQKIKAVQNFLQNSLVMKVRSFAGLTSYYHQFLKNFASFATQFTNSTKKQIPFEWTKNGRITLKSSILCSLQDLS